MDNNMDNNRSTEVIMNEVKVPKIQSTVYLWLGKSKTFSQQHQQM